MRSGFSRAASRLTRLVTAAVAGALLSFGLTGVAHAEPLGKENYTLILNTGYSTDFVIAVSRLNIGDKVAYCIDLDNPNARGDVYAKQPDPAARPENLAKIETVLAYGYGLVTVDDLLAAAKVTKPAGATPEELKVAAYTATQAALWHVAFPERFILPTEPPSARDLVDVKAFAKDSTWHNGEKPRGFAEDWWRRQTVVIQALYTYLTGNLPVPSLAVTPVNSKGRTGSVAGPFTVRAGGLGVAQLTASATGVVIDREGRQVTNLSDGDQFRVSCVEKGSVTVDLKASYRGVAVTVWTGAGGKRIQKVISGAVADRDATAQVTALCGASGGASALGVGMTALGAVAGLFIILGVAGLILLRRRRTGRKTRST